MKVPVKNFKNEEAGEIELPEEVFEYPFKEHLIHTVVCANQAAKRRGTHADQEPFKEVSRVAVVSPGARKAPAAPVSGDASVLRSGGHGGTVSWPAVPGTMSWASLCPRR